jgi:hypothetical protein
LHCSDGGHVIQNTGSKYLFLQWNKGKVSGDAIEVTVNSIDASRLRELHRQVKCTFTAILGTYHR